MRGFQLTVLVIVLATLCAQGVHFVYYKFFYPRESILDDATDKQIQTAQSLDELFEEYQLSVEAFEKAEAEAMQSEDRDNYQRRNNKAYQEMDKLRRAINSWETRERDYKRLWFQWIAGLFLFGGGCLLARVNRPWLGMALIVAGLSEMIWWSSPTFRSIGSEIEFDRLMNAKLLLTFVTIAIVSAAWVVYERHRES